MFDSPFRAFDEKLYGDQVVAVADLDHDGYPDVLSGTGAQGTLLRVRPGRPDFGLGTAQFFTTSIQVTALAIADLDGDGIDDVLVGGGGWGYLPGLGDGTFGPYRPFLELGEIDAVAVADLDGDGLPDIVGGVGEYFPESIVVRMGRGGGAFDSSSFYRLYPPPSAPRWSNAVATGLRLADVNGDGYLDAIASDPWNAGCWILLGTPGGGFGPSTFVGAGGRNVFTGDFNHDGRVDFITGHSVYLGRGDGTFVPGPDLPGDAVEVADFDGDGNPDVVLAHAATVEVLLGRGDGTFSSHGTFPCGPGPWRFAAGDMNGDGRMDLVVSLAGRSAGLCILIGDGQGGFGTLTTVPTRDDPRKVLAADVTGDGIPDLITAERGVRRLALRPGLGGGQFGGRIEFEAAPGLSSATLADLDGDGRPDLIAASDSAGMVSTFLNAPGVGFGARHDFAAGGAPVALATGDFNSDGRPDVVTNIMYFMSFLPGDGAGGLGSAVATGLSGLARAVGVGDFNGDGRLDAVLAGDGVPYGGYAAIFHGDGMGSFQWGPDIHPAGRVSALAVGDLDRNGYSDFALACLDSSGNVYATLETYLEGSSGFQGFIGGQILDIGVIPTDVLLADFDGDGNLDVAVASYGTNSVSVLRGHPDGTFSDRVDYGVADGPVSLAAADLDGDGAPELLVACDRANVVTILHNLSRGSPTPTLVSLVEARADAGGVHLTWDAGGMPGLSATAERRDVAGPWVVRAALTADGRGRLHLDDAQVEPGRTYAYRLGWSARGAQQFSAEVAVAVPAAKLALAGSRPNPADASLRVAFSLPDASPATLDLLDISGRLIRRLEVGSLGAGDHVIALGSGLGIRPGIYLVRLAHGADDRTARIAVIE